jgi:hypothetical protein
MKIGNENLTNEEIRVLRQKIIQYLKQADLNWTVRLEKLRSATGILLPNTVAVIRNDNQKIIGLQKTNYEAFQNHEMLELLYNISKHIKYEKGGSFDDGGKVYFQFKSNDLTIINPNKSEDKINGYITVVNSFNDNKSLAIGETNVTISCQNTFVRAYNELQNKISHTHDMRAKLGIICKEIDTLIYEEKQTFNTIIKMTETGVEDKPEIFDPLLKMLIGIKEINKPLNVEELTTNQLVKYHDIIANINHQFIEKGENLWGLFSGVTRYTSHNALKHDKDKYFGSIGKKDNLAWKYVSNLC